VASNAESGEFSGGQNPAAWFRYIPEAALGRREDFHEYGLNEINVQVKTGRI